MTLDPLTRSPKIRGFTLIEVLVALMIVALGMGAVLSALGSAANTTIQLRERTLANWVALNLVAATRLGLPFPPNGKTQGDLAFAKLCWHWVQQIENYQVPGLRSITVQVRRSDAAVGGDASTTTVSCPSSKDRSDWLVTVTDYHGTALRSGETVLHNYP